MGVKVSVKATNGQRGISSIVATVLIVLITVAAVTIVWTFIIPLFSDSVSFNEGVELTVVTSEGYTVWDSSNKLASVQIKRGNDNLDLKGIEFIFSIEGNSVKYTMKKTEVLAPGTTKTYGAFYVLELDKKPESVRVVALYKVGQGSVPMTGEVVGTGNVVDEGGTTLSEGTVEFESENLILPDGYGEEEIAGNIPSCNGDANGDGVVSVGDYAAIQSNFGNTGEPGIFGDANNDGMVSAGDYASVQRNFGKVCSELGDCNLEEYSEFNDIIEPYCPDSIPKLSIPICDYGEIINGVCWMGTPETRSAEFEDFDVNIEYESRIGNTENDNIKFTMTFENKGSSDLNVGFFARGNEGEITIGGKFIGLQDCSEVNLSLYPKGFDNFCYVNSSFDEVLPAYGTLVLQAEVQEGIPRTFFKNNIGNEVIRIYKTESGEARLIGEIYSVLAFSDEWEEACDGISVPRSIYLENDGETILKDNGKCCNDTFFFGIDNCGFDKELIKREARQVIENLGYPSKVTFEEASQTLNDKLNFIVLKHYYLGRIVNNYALKPANESYIYAVLPTEFQISNQITERSSIWIESQSQVYNMNNNFSVTFINIEENINTADITSTTTQEIARIILTKYKDQHNLNLENYDGFMIIVNDAIIIQFAGKLIAGRANTIIEIDEREYIVNFIHENSLISKPNTFTHELFHNFGAIDLYAGGPYGTDHLVYYPCLMGGMGLGGLLEMLNLCEITAANMGWLDLDGDGIAEIYSA